jgi:hypothetical protein
MIAPCTCPRRGDDLTIPCVARLILKSVSHKSESRERAWFDAGVTSRESGIMKRGSLSAAEIELHAREVGEAGWITAADHANGVSYGEFHAWLSGDRALVRIDEHREWYAREPVRPKGDPVEFFDEGEVSFAAPRGATVSREQALAALAHWLATGDMLRTLVWE